jgi:arylsulfatase A-like enzyme
MMEHGFNRLDTDNANKIDLKFILNPCPIRLIRVLLFFLIIIALSSSKQKQSPPNVILIMTDDQGWGDLSIHGNPYLETPNIDQLAKESARLNRFYVSPLCAPTRASLLTGRYHLRTGTVAVSKGLEIMDADETTLGELFKANQYQTGIFGKWHNGQHFPNHPNDQGFDTFFGFCGGHWSNYFDTKLERNGKMEQTKGFITDVLTDEALKFMQKNKQKPFFCYLPYNAPHSPHQTPESYFQKYKNKGLNDELASIYGMVENVDDNVGRVITYLKDNNLEENTIVIFMTDNGPNGVRYNGEMRGTKSSVYEGGIRVPFFIKWKNKLEPKTIQTPAQHVDVYQTLQDLCGLKPISTKQQDGVSLAKLLLKNEPIAERTFFTHVNFSTTPVLPTPSSVHFNQYTLVMDKKQVELYDIAKDPSQKENIADKNPQIVQKMKSDFDNWFTSATKNLNYERITILSKKSVELPTYEANLTEGVKYKEGHGWVHDWVAQFENSKDSLYWDIDCQVPAKYSLSIDYILEKPNIDFVLGIQNKSYPFTISKIFTSKQIPSPDRIPRKEVYEMENWGNQKIGVFQLKKGKNRIALKPKSSNFPLDFDIKSLTIQPLK